MKIKYAILIIGLLTASCSDKIEDPDVLYQKAISATYKSSFESANTLLKKIEENYPYTEYSRNATVLLAYVNYKLEADELLPIIDVFVKMNPKDSYVPYLLYIKAMSFYDKIKSYKKDRQILNEYLEVAKTIQSIFPDSIYAADLKLRTEFVSKVPIESDIYIALQYQKNDKCISASNRYLEILPFAKGRNLELAKHNLQLCLEEFGIKDYKL